MLTVTFFLCLVFLVAVLATWLVWRLSAQCMIQSTACVTCRGSDTGDGYQGAPIHREAFSLSSSVSKPPPATLLICMAHDGSDTVRTFANHSVWINKMYAKRHHYDFEVFVLPLMKDRQAQWLKIKVLHHVLNVEREKYGHYKYFFWIDCDAFFHKHDVSLESQFLESFPEKDLLICDDVENNANPNNNLVNTGTICVKQSKWSQTFFQTLFEYNGIFLHEPFHEQTVMNQMILRNDLDVQNHLMVFKGTLFNSYYWQIRDKTLEDNFIIHLMATSPTFRQEYMKQWILRFLKEHHHTVGKKNDAQTEKRILLNKE